MQGVAEWLARALECYGAERSLGHIQSESNDPFFLPNRTVHIEVHSAGNAFLVGVRGSTPSDAQAILERANALVAHRTMH